MRIRPAERSDIQRLHEIYMEQGFDYAEPDWAKMSGSVLLDEQGVVQGFELVRKTCETYAGMAKGDWATPGVKAENFRRLDRAVVVQLRAEGYEDQSAWIPPQCRAFLRRMLKELGWVKAEGYVPVIRWFGEV